MKRNNIVIHLSSNFILLKIDNEIKKEEITSVNKGKVINKEEFIKEFQTIQNKYNLNKKIIADDIIVIIDDTYNDIDKQTIYNIFKELYYNEITYKNIKDILNIKNNELIININDKNIKLYTIKETYEFNLYLDEEQEIIDLYIPKLNNINIIKIYGTKNNIEEFEQYIEKISNIKCYHYAHNNQMPLCELKEFITK